jgi:hypothetical protein
LPDVRDYTLSMRITPEDFSSDTPPPRTIGTECEYNMQPVKGDGNPSSTFVNAASMAVVGVRNHHGFLGSEFGSGRAYPDVGHLEFDTAEAVGPASAAVEDLAGIDRLSKIVELAEEEHGGIYRLSGTYIKDGLVDGGKSRSNVGRSSGYHENYLIPREASDTPLTDQLLPTALATRIWAMNGTLRDTFVLSQKVWGLGGAPVERSLARRTTHKNKPMIIIPPVHNDADTIGNAEWARIEVRAADPGLSLVNRFTNFAAFSLTMRLVEQQRRIGADTIAQVCLKDPVEAARQYAGNLALDSTAETLAGKQVTALDTQETLLEMFEQLQEDIALPEDELLSIIALRSIIDGLRQSRPQYAEYSKLSRVRVEFAPKHLFVTEKRPQTQVRAANYATMQRVLDWDRILPEGSGRQYWRAMTAKDPLAPHIVRLAKQSGISRRARRRARMIDTDDGREVVNWSKYKNPKGVLRSLGHPIGD